MAFAPFRNESDQRINVPIRTNMRRFWLVQALHYQPNGFSITPKPDKSLRKNIGGINQALGEALHGGKVSSFGRRLRLEIHHFRTTCRHAASDAKTTDEFAGADDEGRCRFSRRH
jgi:hypothetical protein